MALVNADNVVQTSSDKLADLTAKKAGNLALAKIDLFVNAVTPSPASVLADFILATFTGYVQKAVAGWTANELNNDGSVSSTATNVVSWSGPGDGTGETCRGYLIREAAGGALIAAVLFPFPVSVNLVTDVLDLVATYRIP